MKYVAEEYAVDKYSNITKKYLSNKFNKNSKRIQNIYFCILVWHEQIVGIQFNIVHFTWHCYDWMNSIWDWWMFLRRAVIHWNPKCYEFNISYHLESDPCAQILDFFFFNNSENERTQFNFCPCRWTLVPNKSDHRFLGSKIQLWCNWIWNNYQIVIVSWILGWCDDRLIGKRDHGLPNKGTSKW